MAPPNAMHVTNSGFCHLPPCIAFCPSLPDYNIVHFISYWLLRFFLPRLWRRTPGIRRGEQWERGTSGRCLPSPACL
jgi:hypothetical protein